MGFCVNCGSEVSEILKFCPSCGTPANKDQANHDTESTYQQVDDQNHKQAKKDRYQDLRNRIERYKPMWDKDGVIQFKSDHIAILQRKLGMQVEFMIAFEDLTKEGFELKAIDEGTESSYSKGVNSFYYFQKFST